jgi:Transposase DDE domain
MDVANELRDKGALDEAECFIDATFVMAKGGGAEIGPTKRGKGMKIMAIVDRHGLPLSVSTHAANHHEVRLVQLCFDFYMIEAKPENLIGDRAYDSDPLDEELRKDGIDMIAPHRYEAEEVVGAPRANVAYSGLAVADLAWAACFCIPNGRGCGAAIESKQRSVAQSAGSARDFSVRHQHRFVAAAVRLPRLRIERD